MSHTKSSTKPLVKRMPKHIYEEELERLQIQLVSMQQWVIETGARSTKKVGARCGAVSGSVLPQVPQRSGGAA